MPATRMKAPEFGVNANWLNTDVPVRIADQFGKVVLLEFVHEGDVKCKQLINDTVLLQKKYRDGLTAIGILSPKFPHQGEPDHIENTINRHQIGFPLISDNNYKWFKKFGVREWPTIILIDAEGYIVGAIRGKNNREKLERLIQQHLNLAEMKNIRQCNKTPLKDHLLKGDTLSYPGRVYATENKIYVADSGHNRILEINPQGYVTRTFGSFHPGLLDGNESDALFNSPQGMEKVNDFLYVADSGNHAIRRIHLQTGEVHTVMGNGMPGKLNAKGYNDASQAQLNSPWALNYYRGEVYVCMAGLNQIWKWQLSMNQFAPLFGSGEESLRDGAAPSSSFAQPMGICGSEFGLYVVDAESSAVRLIRMPDGYVSTLVGAGLFEFGDEDGAHQVARLQHPMDIQYDQKRQIIWICDTYNNKLKYLRLNQRDVNTLSLQGLDEPSGLHLHNDTLWICNTNAHQLIKLNLEHGQMSVIEVHE